MTIDFKDFSEDFLKEEQEKAQFGGEIYANHHKLPAIIIDNDNIRKPHRNWYFVFFLDIRKIKFVRRGIRFDRHWFYFSGH